MHLIPQHLGLIDRLLFNNCTLLFIGYHILNYILLDWTTCLDKVIFHSKDNSVSFG